MLLAKKLHIYFKSFSKKIHNNVCSNGFHKAVKGAHFLTKITWLHFAHFNRSKKKNEFKIVTLEFII